MRLILTLALLSTQAAARVGEPYEEFKKRVGVQPKSEQEYRSGAFEAEFTIGEIKVQLVAHKGVIYAEDYWSVTEAQTVVILAKQGEWRKIRSVGTWLWAGPNHAKAELDRFGTLRISLPHAEKIRELMKAERDGDQGAKRIKDVDKF